MTGGVGDRSPIRVEDGLHRNDRSGIVIPTKVEIHSKTSITMGMVFSS